ncbi:4HBT domain-containing protein [Psidium guajava]|nr:4HBT domain-containing protein [Psidium guajava]
MTARASLPPPSIFRVPPKVRSIRFQSIYPSVFGASFRIELRP